MSLVSSLYFRFVIWMPEYDIKRLFPAEFDVRQAGMTAATYPADKQAPPHASITRVLLFVVRIVYSGEALWARIFLGVVVLMSQTCCGALAAPPAGFTWKLWQTQDGLPEQTVQAFAQTPDHYLWIGTTGGLLRFDGARFTVFNHDNTPELKENSIFALLVSRDGSLWIGTEGGGLTRYSQDHFRAYGTQDGLSDGFVRALFEDHSGVIWVGTDNGLLKFAGNRLQRIDGMDGRPSIAVHAISEDSGGGLWVGGSRLLRLSQGTMREYKLEGGSSQNRVKSILETSDHTVWVGTVSGLHRLRPGKDSFERVEDVKGTVRTLRQTTDGVLWMGMIGQGIRSLNGSESTTMKAPDALPSNTVLNIFEDDERNIWIGTQAGLLRLTHTPVRIVPLPQAADSDFGTIFADRDGTLWVVSTEVFRMRNGIIEPYTFPGLGRVQVRNLFRDRAGSLWIGTDGDGVIRMDGKGIMRLSTKTGLVNNFVRAILESRDGSMWIATDEGLSHWSEHGITNYQMRDGLAYFSTRALLEDRNGDLWIGTDRGLSHLHSGAFIHDRATESLSQKKVWAAHEDSDGGIWFGTRNDGLYRWRQGRLSQYSTKEGLASNSIYQIVEDNKADFWISGPNGISLLSRRELDEAADQPARHLALTLYSISNEVETTQIYGGRQPSGCLDAQGDVWFPSNRGPMHILRKTIQPSYLPPVVVNDVLIDGRQIPIDHSIVMEPGNGRLEVVYSPILLRSQDGVRFRYWLEGFDPEWIDASTRRVASYTNLPAGTFTFHVAAFEVNNPQAISESSFTITQKPHFYRTNWFLAGCILLLGTLILSIYRFRLWQIKMRFEAVIEERSRLAREMHDTVIQGCASISALLEALASMNLGGGQTVHDLLEHARTQVRSTVDEARQAVWNLRQKNPAQNSLGPAVSRMAGQIASESGIPVECVITGKPFVLNQFATHELMMMAREALYNAVLHGKPSRIEIGLSFAQKDVTLEVRDNGRGFDPAAIRSNQGCHYGLIGMRERVQSVGGRFQLESEIGRGTEIRIKIPRKVFAPQSVMLGA